VLAGQAGDQTFAGAATLRIPPANADYDLAFDDVAGDETFYVLASPRPLSETDAEAAALVQRMRSGEPITAAVDTGRSPAADAGAVATTTTPDAAMPRDAAMPSDTAMPSDAAIPTEAASPPDAAIVGAPVRPVETAHVQATRAGAGARSGMSGPVAFGARGIERRQKTARKIVVDADAGNVVVFPYSIVHAP
jgi:hypothetical protein